MKGHFLIANFADDETEALFREEEPRNYRKFPPSIHKQALRKLDMLNAATKIEDLRSPPGNRLEKLKGSLKEFWSVRVNDQWRIIFQWDGQYAFQVSLTDYH